MVDPRIRERIIAACDLTKDDVVLEIGPGKGALTRPLADRVKKFSPLRKIIFSPRNWKKESAGTNVAIEHADILKYPFEQLPAPMKVVGNLPYNIATPIIEKVLAFRHKFSVFYMTVQLEYGNRIVARPGNKEYGSLSCFVQYYAQAQKLFKIRRRRFVPPQGRFLFLSLRMRPEPARKARDEEFLFKLIRACFSQRREPSGIPWRWSMAGKKGRSFTEFEH